MGTAGGHDFLGGLISKVMLGVQHLALRRRECPPLTEQWGLERGPTFHCENTEAPRQSEMMSHSHAPILFYSRTKTHTRVALMVHPLGQRKGEEGKTVHRIRSQESRLDRLRRNTAS